MKLPRLFSLGCALMLVSGALHAAPPAPLVSDPPAGSEMLWDGHDTAGWTIFLQGTAGDPAAFWSATDGTLSFPGKPFGYLRSQKTYANYYLHLEWRYPADAPATADSGVFIDVQGADKIWPTSIECHLKPGDTGQIIALDSGITIPGAPMIHNRQRVSATGPKAEKPFGEWNSCDIFSRGDTVEVYVNGLLENHVEKITATSGALGLQIEGTPIQFRNLWLNPLP
jgi:hypothetical protein